LNGRILAVDDQRYFRELLEGMLTDVGFAVVTASSGEEALSILDRSSFDVIVTDLVMPGMSGTELVQAVKARDPGQEIILVTGVVDVRSAVEAMKVGATDYLLKPFDREALANSIATLLERKNLASERDRLLEENIEYLGERALYSRSIALFRSVNTGALCEQVLEGVAEETQAQGAVLWMAEGEPAEQFTLGAVRGLVRVQEERERLDADLVDPRLRSGGTTVFAGGGGPSDTHPSMWVALRAGTRLIGIIRLTDKAGGSGFDDVDRATAEKLLQLAEGAFRNAERFQAVEQRVLQDPDTNAYHPDYLKGVVRNEIEKANRFGRSFGLLKISLSNMNALRTALGQNDFERWLREVTGYVTRHLRSTDLAAADGTGTLYVLLAESDGIGAASFRARLRDSLERCGAMAGLAEHVRPVPAFGAVACPADGSRLEALMRKLDERVERDALGRLRDQEFDGLTLSVSLGRMLDLGHPEAAEGASSIVDFALRELARRPREHNLVFLHPGEAHSEALARWLEDRSDGEIASEVVVIAPPLKQGGTIEGCSFVAPERLGGAPPFLVHFGDGPPFVLITGDKALGGELQTFQSADRSLVEYLAFRLQRELGVPRFQ
jgi:diguanylate cyclase (GGDEF)-like protein